MNVLVVITSYKVKELTLDCLKSLADEVAQNPGVKVGICDNGNIDNTSEFLGKAIDENGWQNWAYIKRVSPNRGFSGGSNVILSDALDSKDKSYDFYLLLNADTIVQPGAISKLLETASNRPRAGIIGPSMKNIDGTPMQSCFRFISPVSELIRVARTGLLTKLLNRWNLPLQGTEAAMSPDWISFDCALIRKEVVEEIGVLDEGYYLYFDDVDYCRSAHEAGWEVFHEPGAAVVHYEGQSSPVVENAAKMKRQPDYWYISRSWYFKKFYGRSGLILSNLFWYTGRMVSLSREILGNKKSHVCKGEWSDIWKGFSHPR